MSDVAANPMVGDVDRSEEKVVISLRLDVVLDPNGEDAVALQEQMGRAFERAIGNGALTGETAAEVDQYSMSSVVLAAAEAGLDEEQVEAWLADQLESGAMKLEEVVKLMARYALTDPAAMRQELAERMGLNEVAMPEIHSVDLEVQATIASDDGLARTQIDVSAWLRQATEQEIVDLRDGGWGGDCAADEVARFFEPKHQEVADLLAHCRTVADAVQTGVAHKNTPCGFECHVNGEQAMAWMKVHRRGLWAMFVCEDNGVRLVEAQEDEIRGRWDWLDDMGNASDASMETEQAAALDAVRVLGMEG